jgi:hypothetical protein
VKGEAIWCFVVLKPGHGRDDLERSLRDVVAEHLSRSRRQGGAGARPAEDTRQDRASRRRAVATGGIPATSPPWRTRVPRGHRPRPRACRVTLGKVARDRRGQRRTSGNVSSSNCQRGRVVLPGVHVRVPMTLAFTSTFKRSRSRRITYLSRSSRRRVPRPAHDPDGLPPDRFRQGDKEALLRMATRFILAGMRCCPSRWWPGSGS